MFTAILSIDRLAVGDPSDKGRTVTTTSPTRQPEDSLKPMQGGAEDGLVDANALESASYGCGPRMCGAAIHSAAIRPEEESLESSELRA